MEVSSKKKVKYARKALQGFEEKILETLSATRYLHFLVKY